MTSQPFFIPALLIGVAAIPLILGLVPRNRMYGFRTAKTLSGDNVWYRSNKCGGWAFIFSSVIYLVVAKIWPNLEGKDAKCYLWLLHVGAFVFPLIASVALTMRYVRKL